MVTQELPEEGQRDPPHALLKVKSVTCCRAGERRAYATSWTGPKESDLVSRLASCSLKCDFLPPHTATQHSVDTPAPPLPEHASRKACECVPTTSAPLSGPGPCSCSHGSGFSTPPRQQRKAPEFRLPPHGLDGGSGLRTTRQGHLWSMPFPEGQCPRGLWADSTPCHTLNAEGPAERACLSQRGPSWG